MNKDDSERSSSAQSEHTQKKTTDPKHALSQNQKRAHTHDAFFKRSLRVPQLAKEFFQAYLPKHMADAIKFDSLKPTSASYVDKHFKSLHSDMVFTAELADGSTGYLYLLVEHQSSPDVSMVDRMIWYCIRLLEAHRRSHPDEKLPVLYPLVYYHGQTTPYPHTLDWLSAFDDPGNLMQETLSHPLRIIDAQQQADEDITQHHWLRIMSLIFKYIRSTDYSPLYLQLVQQLASLLPDQQVLDYLRDVAEYLSTHLPLSDMEIMMKTVESADLPEESRKTFVSHADYLLHKGFDEGLEKGIERERRKTLKRFATKRFGPLPQSALTQIQQADLPTLELFLENVLDATSLEEWLGL